MNSTAEKDEAFGDGYMNISKTKKRLIRVTMKSYENTGTYVFLKVFKCGSTADKEFKLHQQISLNMEEFNKLICVADKVRYFEKENKENVPPESSPDEYSCIGTIIKNSNNQ